MNLPDAADVLFPILQFTSCPPYGHAPVKQVLQIIIVLWPPLHWQCHLCNLAIQLFFFPLHPSIPVLSHGISLVSANFILDLVLMEPALRFPPPHL